MCGEREREREREKQNNYPMVLSLSLTDTSSREASTYEALNSMRRVCSCNPTWVRYYHEDMGWGPFVDRPCVCGCPWRHGEYIPEWPWGVIDHVGPGYEPHVRPADSLRAEGYPDDPAIVDNPYHIGLFLGAPQLRRTVQTLFPPLAPGPPPVTLRVPSSSSGSASLFPPGGDWQGIIAHLAEEPGARTGEDRQDGGGESSRARTGEASDRDYPTAPQVVHKEKPREGAGYAYRGTIVGEASHPGPADPGAVLRGRQPIAARCCDCDPTDLRESRASLTSSGESPLASPMGESGCPCRRALSADGGGSLPPACGNELGPPGRGTSPEAGPMGKSGCGYWCAPFGLHKAGPREGARYGYRGVIFGEASHPGPVPSPADLSGAASPGEVLRYIRPTAGAGLGPSRGGGHRQGRGEGLKAWPAR